MTRKNIVFGKGGFKKSRVFKMKKSLFAVLLSALLVLSCFNVSALSRTAVRYPTPAGYNEHDYQLMVAFMETEDENGVKNGEKIVSFYNGSYDPAYPEGWSYSYYDHENAILYIYGVFFTDGTDRRVTALTLHDMDLVGELDASDCTELYELTADSNRFSRIDVSGCPDLRMVLCRGCGITELNIAGCTGLDVVDCAENGIQYLDFSGCPAIRDIDCSDNGLRSINLSGCTQLNSLLCGDNALTELDVSDSRSLYWLYCGDNHLTELDISNNPALSVFDCAGNELTSLDLSENYNLYFNSVSSEGAGFIGYTVVYGFGGTEDTLTAAPEDGADFVGWYSESGVLISENAELKKSETDERNVTALFTSAPEPTDPPTVPVQGDANGDGNVDAADALIVLRYALGISSLPCEQTVCDMNGDGSVDGQDALLILRTALGTV